MTQIYANNFTTLVLGRRGENLARQVVFDIRDLESLYGHGDVEVIYQRPCDAQPYPLTVKREGTLVTWDVTSTDTEMSDGSGKCELRYYVGDTLAKSKTWQTWVETAMDTPSETAPPEPEQGWVDQVLTTRIAAEKAAADAKAAADRVASLAEEVSKKAAQTAQDASDAAKAMEAAQTAQRLAEEAQSAAEAARTAAAAAQSAAEKAATDAAGAKQDAETAQKAAQDAAAAAANALESIQTLYQEMQTWAQGVIQDVNAAGSAAVQSVQSAGDAQVQRVTDEGVTQTANAKAQANAAAQSASGAAQSAQEAAESAAVYDTVVADVNQLKTDVVKKIDAPENPTVGKILKIKSVNEDGTFVCEWADDESGAVDDVQINGTSLVADGVANIKASGYGIGHNDAGLYLVSATNNQINARKNNNISITPLVLDYAVKAAMCDGKGPAWTSEEQAAARERMGLDKPFELIEEITLEEDTISIVRNTDLNGIEYDFQKVFIGCECSIVGSAGNAGFNIGDGYNLIQNIALGTTINTTTTNTCMMLYIVNGVLFAKSTQSFTHDWTFVYSSTPSAVIYGGLKKLESIKNIKIYQFNNRPFAAGSKFTIYGVRS